jgi:glucose/mannose-6-phosphate isomerase
MYMLDEATIYRQFDPQQALEFAGSQPEQLGHDFGLVAHQFRAIRNVVVAGMGGSALAGELVKTWPTLSAPFEVCRSYELPAYVDEQTLVICDSYSGTTEETLAVFDDAKSKGAQLAVITHGGPLQERAEQAHCPLAIIPECPQPRMAVFYSFRALVELLVAAQVTSTSAIVQLQEVMGPLKSRTAAWAPTIAVAQNPAKKLAEHLVGKTLIVYAGPYTAPAAYKWKIDANENAKNTAWMGIYSEFNHNEFIGWTGHPVEKPFGVVDLVSSFEHPRVVARFELSDRLLSGMRPKAWRVDAEGESLLEHLLYLVLFGDFVTLYWAMLNGVNPVPIDLVERFKKALRQELE